MDGFDFRVKNKKDDRRRTSILKRNRPVDDSDSADEIPVSKPSKIARSPLPEFRPAAAPVAPSSHTAASSDFAFRKATPKQQPVVDGGFTFKTAAKKDIVASDVPQSKKSSSYPIPSPSKKPISAQSSSGSASASLAASALSDSSSHRRDPYENLHELISMSDSTKDRLLQLYDRALDAAFEHVDDALLRGEFENVKGKVIDSLTRELPFELPRVIKQSEKLSGEETAEAKRLQEELSALDREIDGWTRVRHEYSSSALERRMPTLLDLAVDESAVATMNLSEVDLLAGSAKFCYSELRAQLQSVADLLTGLAECRPVVGERAVNVARAISAHDSQFLGSVAHEDSAAELRRLAKAKEDRSRIQL
eukprot:ANDGO_01242.mRNA.1 hypothetical protein